MAEEEPERAEGEPEDGPEREPEEAPGDEAPEEFAPSWFDFAQQTVCPACGAPGAVMLGEGVFCPSCGEVTTPRSGS